MTTDMHSKLHAAPQLSKFQAKVNHTLITETDSQAYLTFPASPDKDLLSSTGEKNLASA